MLKRKVLSVTILILLTSIGATVSFAQGSNVVSNSDFLSGSTNWTSNSSGSGSGVAFGGTGTSGTPIIATSATIRAATDGAFASLSQSSISLTSGDTYRFVFGYKVNRTTGMTFEVELNDGVNSILYDIPLVGGETEFVKDFVVPAGFGTAALTFTVTNTSGTILSRFAVVDNISITKLR